MIGIIGAMSQEVANLKEAMDNVKVEETAGMEFFQGTIKGREAVVVRSGIGKVNGAVCGQISRTITMWTPLSTRESRVP